MSFAGLKKQINKANQYVSEKMGAAEATKLDDAYTQLERKIDVTSELIDDIIAKTREFLQPNPATRAKMATTATLSKWTGSTSKSVPYPQSEGVLGEAMLKHGKALGDDSNLGKALIEAGESFKMMADVKYALEENVNQNFIDPLSHLQSNDLKEVAHHRKKLQGRRLDYDCKKRKQKDAASAQIIEEEMKQAEDKLEESKKLAETAMFNVLDNDVEQISQLCAFIEAQLDFNKQTGQILEALSHKLKNKIQHAANRPRCQHVPRSVFDEQENRRRSSSTCTPRMAASGTSSLQNQPKTSTSSSIGVGRPASGGGNQDPWDAAWTNQAPPPYQANQPPSNGRKQPRCRADYDFDAENPGELSFKEGQIIHLIARVDENWFEGSVAQTGRRGYLPVSYVTVLEPL